MKYLNNDLRFTILNMITKSKEGHLPSSFSIVDIINFMYENILNVNKTNYKTTKRDYFILSKGHGCAALYVVLNKIGILSNKHIDNYGMKGSILGGHPDLNKVPGVEASTGSLGHGFPTAVGIALGLKIQKKNNKVYVLLGDGECHEGTIWESANVAKNQNLENLTAIIDLNESAMQLMPFDKLQSKWKSFGWDTYECDGHNNKSLKGIFNKIKKNKSKNPKAIIARTIKGKGVKMLEGHGKWHHKIPNEEEYNQIVKELGI
tara:strand:- start:15135 stop:15920 length:786 start_codon:yes stop_codon:yes gene_type:complete